MSDDSLKADGDSDKNANKAERQEARLKRQAARAEKSSEGERANRICTLNTVEVKKDHEGYHVAVSSGGGRRSFVIAANEVGPILKDLETAIQVIRGQQ